MTPANVRPVSGSTQKPDATLPPPATFAAAVEVRARTERVRSLLRQHLPHGAKRAIAEALCLRTESVTRQLDPQNTERLTEDVAILSQTFLEQVGQSEVAHEIRELRHAGLATVAIMLPRGVDLWSFTVNVRTGEVK
jgi:hypothetical protein